MMEKLPNIDVELTTFEEVVDHREKINEIVAFVNSIVSTAGGLEFQPQSEDATTAAAAVKEYLKTELT
jgi:hypothetical protein